MAASITEIRRLARGSWRYTWSGTSPFYVYQDGVSRYNGSTTLTTDIFLNNSDYEPPQIEIVDSTGSTATMQQVLYPPYFVFQWRWAYRAEQYVIRQYDSDSGDYEDRQTIREDGSGYYQFQTQALADATMHLWKVVAQDGALNESELDFSMEMIRNPDPPALSFSYSAATGNVTIAERA